MNEAARKRHNAVALDGLRHYGAGQQAQTDLGRIVKPKEMLAAPARLHLRVGVGDVTIESFDGFRFQIDGETDTGAERQNDNDEKQPGQLQSAPTGFLAAASTTSR